jgi:hypothetical protein
VIYALCIIGGIAVGVVVVGALLIYAVNVAIMKGLGW